MISRKPPLKNVDDFINQAKDVKIDKKEISKTEELEKIKRQTYYITELQRQALAIMAAHEDIEKSEIIRRALESYIPDKYIKMVLMK